MIFINISLQGEAGQFLKGEKKMKRACGLLFSIVFFLTGYSLQAGEFPLMVNDVSGLDSPWPIIASIPFAEGEIKDSSSIRIMSGGREVPSQVDVVATWRDGSIRWVLAGFTASPKGKYNVEYGAGVKRGEYPDPLRVTRQADGGFTVDTGAAVYQFDNNKMLPENGWLVSDERKTQILKDSGAGVYLVDNAGRMARISGTSAEINNEFLKEGPGRLAVKRSGWYVTDTGEKLARAEIWLYFSAGLPHIRVTHTLIFTEDTNKLWLRDYGLEFRTSGKPNDIYCAVGETGEEVRKTVNTGDGVYLLQSEYPHFAEREYKATIGKLSGGQDSVVEEIKTAGDWAHGDYGTYGITLVMPWLAERYPKEISFEEKGARAVLWSGRSGKELDFRGKTLVKEYWQSWAEKAPGSPGVDKLSAFESNAQGSARTHDIWFLPHTGSYNEEIVKNTALAGSRQVLAIADPVWLCETEAMGYPMLHKDSKRFPEEEAVLSEYWQRFILPLKAFPYNGFIDWGDFPTWYYQAVGGRIMANFHILTYIDRYTSRREPWRLFARSGERTYYDHGHRFSRFSGDWYLIHESRKGDPSRKRGSFMSFSPRGGALPFVWGQTGNLYNGGDMGCWLMEYYLTGDERSLELLKIIKESVKKYWKVESAIPVNQSKVLRELVTLSTMDWDEDIMRMTREVAHSMFDLESQNGMKIFKDGYGPMYKDQRTCHNTVEYYLATKDELAKEAFLKLMDQLYRFDRRGSFGTYKNYSGFTGSLAYWMTDDERHRKLAEQGVRDAVHYIREHPISADLKNLPENPLDWKKMPDYLGIWEWHNPFIGLPTALKLIAEKGWSGVATPLVVKPVQVPDAKIIFLHRSGIDTVLSIKMLTRIGVKPEVPEVTSYGKGLRVEAIAQFEKRMPRGPWFDKNPDVYPEYCDSYHAYVKIPSQTPGGLYLLSPGKNITFTLLDISTEKAALYCPKGFWSVSMGQHSGSLPYGRNAEGMPAFFRVPEGVEHLEIFLGSRSRIKRADGSVAVEMSDENTGKISIPVNEKIGIWSIEPDIRNIRGTTPPSFARLLNVEPIVAFGTSASLPDKTSGKPVFSSEPPPLKNPVEFQDGLSGMGLRLSKDGFVRFNRGKKVEDGYEYFPQNKGTVEFWFRVDRSTYEIPMNTGKQIDIPLLKSHQMIVSHRYKFLTRSGESMLRMQLLPAKSGIPATGFQTSCYLKGMEWVHMAFTWDVNKGEKSMEGNMCIYVNGQKKSFIAVSYGLTQFNKSMPFDLSDNGEDIIIGPFEGTMDMLRISDTVRYENDFQPSTNYGSDKNTRAFFQFDGNLKGESAFSKEPVEAK